MKKILTEKFFERDTKIVAQELLGKFLVRKVNGREYAFMIMETEAYDGKNDRASHAFRGLTARNKVMFGPPGYLYVYLCYGLHYLLNITTREKGHPAAVLIRGVEGISGPGKVTRSLHINKTLNLKKASPLTGLWFEDRGIRVRPSKIKRAKRVGVNYAGAIWAEKKLRFLIRS